ncbi:MAG TPA: hypothetical protein DEQ61_07410 [Streptomyces sp.]|nr:hypothetical protein [Streptomyces sp.]
MGFPWPCPGPGPGPGPGPYCARPSGCQVGRGSVSLTWYQSGAFTPRLQRNRPRVVTLSEMRSRGLRDAPALPSAPRRGPRVTRTVDLSGIRSAEGSCRIRTVCGANNRS